MKRSKLLATIAVGLGLIGSSAANAADPVTAVTELKATVGASVAVAGKSTYAPSAKIELGTDPAGDHYFSDVPAPSGTDLRSASITAVSPALLHFEVGIGDMPEGGMKEIINYNLPFNVGTSTYELNAHASSAVVVTCGVVFQCEGTSEDLGKPMFSLNICAPDPDTGQKTCAVNRLTGELTANSVVWHVPAAKIGATAGDVDLEPADIIAASQSVGGVTWWTDGSRGDTMAWELESLFFHAPKVSFGIAPAGTDPATVELSTTVKAKPNGSFTGSLTKPAAGEHVLVARTCFGTDNCSERVSTAVTVA